MTIQAEIDGAQGPSRKIKSPTDLTALGTIGLTIEKVGRVVVRTGKTDAAELADRVEELRSKWREKTAEFASDQMEQLDELAASRQIIEGRLKDLQRQAAEEEDAESLAAELADVEKARKVLLAEDNALGGLDLSKPEAIRQSEQAASVCESANQVLEQLGEALEEAVDQFETTREAETEAAKAVAAARATADQNKQQAARIREEDGLSDSDRRAKLKAALQAKDEAQQRFDTAEKPPVEDVADEVGRLEEQLQSLANQQRIAERRIAQLDTQLTQAGGQGLYSQLVGATERQEDLARQAERARIDSEAIKLLWDTLQRHKQRAFEAVVEPVRRIVVSAGLNCLKSAGLKSRDRPE